ncbi:transcription termination/antitermination protein NusG [Thermotoga sp. 38H-to]|uniref:transcription termination/antitermination protein NusG n=1 Tax=Thermotoga sp. 38H-to TaxID=1755812 RepID=UPI0013EDAEA4|nr:transcription termination/antitermination protein NusG [Thermotoga sp. 38H-to]KAF2960041.1 antitermination protein NusG [Thermotoga sp. 38H-to]
MKKNWYIVLTMSGYEERVKENIEKKIEATGIKNLVGRIVIPEEVVLDATSPSERLILSPKAKLHVSNGKDINKGNLIAEEPPIYARRSGVIVDVKNVRKIVVETIDRKYTKTYYIPESAGIEPGLRVGTKVKQGLPLSKSEEYICELDGKIVEIERMKKVVVQTSDGEQDVYYIPLDVFDRDRIKKGKEVKQGEMLAETRKFFARISGRVEVVDYLTRKEIRIYKTKRRKLFPGYVFVEMIMNDEAYNFVRSVPYVMGFVSSGGQPIPVKDREMRPILRLAGLEEYEEKKKPVKVEIGFKIGDMVKIISGPFEDFAGVIKEIDPERQELKVNVTIFGRETPVVLHISEVEKIE